VFTARTTSLTLTLTSPAIMRVCKSAAIAAAQAAASTSGFMAGE
jgi:hypothetical protein